MKLENVCDRVKYNIEEILNKYTHEKLNEKLSSKDVREICRELKIGKIVFRLKYISGVKSGQKFDYVFFDLKSECEQGILYLYEIDGKSVGEVEIYPLKGAKGNNDYQALSDLLCLLVRVKNSSKFLDKVQYYDTQTGVPNLRLVKEKISKLRPDGDLSEYAIIYANVQNFKYINDCGGVASGDVAIVKYTHKLVALAKEDEAIGRLGGDHFILCVKRDSLDLILKNLECITISDLPNIGDRKFVLSAWAGVMISDDKSLDFDVRMQCAVDAYTMAKAVMKQRVVYYDTSFKNRMDWSRIVRELLGKRIKEQDIYPVFQAKVNMRTGELVGFEALSRWNYKGRIVSPNDYVPILDAHGMIHSLDMKILHKTCECIRKWLDMGIDIPVISVNISRKNLFVPDIDKIMIDIVNSVGIDSKYLDIEITESSTEEEFSRLIDFIRKMRAMGFKISIDDFGVGYSSLSLLHTIDADVIKFDKSFADNICISNKVEYIVETIVNYANKIGMTTIAEGVESIEQGKKLVSIGCEYCQGFYYGVPLSYEDATNRIIHPDYKPIDAYED